MAFLQTHALPPVCAIVLFQKPSSVDIPLKKATETDLYIPIEVIVPLPAPFFGGISTEEGNKKRVFRNQLIAMTNSSTPKNGPKDQRARILSAYCEKR